MSAIKVHFKPMINIIEIQYLSSATGKGKI